MKETTTILCLCMGTLMFVSCGYWPKSISVNDYVDFLEKHISILQNEKLIGWSADAPRVEEETYWLRYNYDNPWPKKDDTTRYMNCFYFATKEQSKYSTSDTIALCNEWNIDVAEYSNYIDSISQAFYTLVHGYRIDHVQFYEDGLCFFSSSRNGWNLFYRNNSVAQSVEKQEACMISKGYSRIEGTDFWLKSHSDKK